MHLSSEHVRIAAAVPATLRPNHRFLVADIYTYSYYNRYRATCIVTCLDSYLRNPSETESNYSLLLSESLFPSLVLSSSSPWVFCQRSSSRKTQQLNSVPADVVYCNAATVYPSLNQQSRRSSTHSRAVVAVSNV